jgi:hypothetical protein
MEDIDRVSAVILQKRNIDLVSNMTEEGILLKWFRHIPALPLLNKVPVSL